MVGVDRSDNDTGSERSGRVERATSVVDAEELGNKESDSNTNWGDEGAAVLLGSKHEDGEDEHSGEEHLTARLKKPPLILKKTQAFTAREKPKQREM